MEKQAWEQSVPFLPREHSWRLVKEEGTALAQWLCQDCLAVFVFRSGGDHVTTEYWP